MELGQGCLDDAVVQLGSAPFGVKLVDWIQEVKPVTERLMAMVDRRFQWHYLQLVTDWQYAIA